MSVGDRPGSSAYSSSPYVRRWSDTSASHSPRGMPEPWAPALALTKLRSVLISSDSLMHLIWNSTTQENRDTVNSLHGQFSVWQAHVIEMTSLARRVRES